MAEMQAVASFDKAERECVQMTLRRYMEEHSIGVPTLMDRISDADEPRHREIPLSTLQRFVINPLKTQHHHVALCHAFVRELPYFSAENELAELGKSIVAMFRGPQDETSVQPDSIRLAGEFSARVVQQRSPDQGVMALYDSSRSVDRVDYSTFVFEPASAAGYLRVSERVFNPNAVDLIEHPSQSSFLFEGVAVVTSSDTVVVIQRDMLTRQPRTCYLTRISEQPDNVPAPYYGQAIWVPIQFRPASGEQVSRIEYFHLIPAADAPRKSNETVSSPNTGPEINE